MGLLTYKVHVCACHSAALYLWAHPHFLPSRRGAGGLCRIGCEGTPQKASGRQIHITGVQSTLQCRKVGSGAPSDPHLYVWWSARVVVGVATRRDGTVLHMLRC